MSSKERALIEYDKYIIEFIKECQIHDVEMIMVGGAAVNLHGYQRHSSDVDFWIRQNRENFNKLVAALKKLNLEIRDLPIEVINGEQNISIKISPITEIELITRFNPNKTFSEAHLAAEKKVFYGVEVLVISLEDLIVSKAKSGRYKDLLDIYELKNIHNIE